MHPSRRVTATAILAIASLAIGVSPVAADCQMAGPIEDELAAAEVAFVGTAAQVNGAMAFFEVHEVWAGPVVNTVEVHGLASGVEFVEDDRIWAPGMTYLVIPWVEGQVLRDSICTATIEWNDDLADLRPADAVIVASEGETGGVPTAVIVLLGAVIGVGGVSMLAFRRRGEESR
jgi:hypothetical protein